MRALLVHSSLALAAAPGFARADLLWDNGEWDQATGVSSERNTRVPESWTVDDFVVGDAVVLREMEWLGVWEPSAEWVAADVILLTAEFEPIAELFELNYASEFEGYAFGDMEVYRLTMSGLDLDVGPGRYYIGARFVGNGQGAGFAACQYAIHGETEAYFRSEYYGYPDWVPTGYSVDTVFTLYGDVVPAPATLAIVLPGLVAFRRRR